MNNVFYNSFPYPSTGACLGFRRADPINSTLDFNSSAFSQMTTADSRKLKNHDVWVTSNVIMLILSIVKFGQLFPE
jgi:hypothetical protein